MAREPCSLLFLLLVLRVPSIASSYSFAQPRLLVHRGYRQLTDTVYNLAPPFTTVAQEVFAVPGEKMTLEIAMDGTERYDYFIQQCTADNIPFIHDGCFTCIAPFVEKWETDRYGTGATKRTMVHFTSPHSVMHIQCEILVISCCACAERVCERAGVYGVFPSRSQLLAVTISLTSARNWSSQMWIPWWLWFLLALLALLLLLALIALCCFCFIRGRSRAKVAQTRVAPLPSSGVAPVGDGFRTPSECTAIYSEPQVNVSRSDSAHITTRLHETTTTSRA